MLFWVLLLGRSRYCLTGSLLLHLIIANGRHLSSLSRCSWRRVCIEIVDEHRWIFHHTLGCHHEPGLHLVKQGALLLVVLAMFEVTIVTSARVTKATWHVWVHIDAFLTVGALGEKLALFFRVHILTLIIWLATFRPVFAAN